MLTNVYGARVVLPVCGKRNVTNYLFTCVRGHNMSGHSDGRSDDLLRHVTHFDTPDRRAHTILRIASKGLRRKGHVYSLRVPRLVQSTLMHLITGHAFVGDYCLKFQRKNLPPTTEEVTCACRAVPEDTEHVLLHCPLTHDQHLSPVYRWAARFARQGQSSHPI